MSKRRFTVADLAREASLEVDEVLVTLWDEGFDSLMGSGDWIGKTEVNRARRVLGIATRRDVKTADYWMSLFSMGADDFAHLLRQLGHTPLRSGPGLPKKAIGCLRAEARRQGLDPNTGARLPPASSHTICARPEDRRLGSVEEFVFEAPGHERSLRYLTVDEVIRVHHALVEDFLGSADPIDPPGVRSMQLLESACYRPETSLGGVLKYPTIESAAAALLHAIVLNHPFHNGNKRTGLVAALVFLDENGLFPEFDQDELFKMVLQVAQHRISPYYPDNMSDREVLAASLWLCQRTRLTTRGERPLSWRKLKQVLSAHGCEFEHPNVGNRLNITRRFESRGFFGRAKTQVLKTQVAYTDDGRDADVSLIKKIRADLKLDDEHGADSEAFYSYGPFQASDFIAKYRKTLRRLAKL